MAETSKDTRGRSFPLGATPFPHGVNFSVFSKRAEVVELLLFDSVEAPKPSRIITLNPRENRTYYYWTVFAPGVKVGQIYGYRVRGPSIPQEGLLFDPQKVLLDPYGRCVARPANYSRQAASRPGDNTPVAIKSVVADPAQYDWENDAPLHRPFVKSVIYELNVRGFTQHPSSGVTPSLRGTYAGLIEKIPYLKELGVSAVELLPVFAFDQYECPAGLVNLWGYSPVAFFAPHDRYSSRRDPLGALDEFRDMVKALHRAGIEVLLDVVYNHTGESDLSGPTLSFRGLSNETYYILQDDRASYADYSGCGNTLNANEPIVRRMILDSLRYWVEQMHVDGFRFDLASVLSRDEQGRPMASPPILRDIESDPVLANVKLIAEAWDAAGLYQVGRFVGDTWKEWNGRFRDDVRAFLKGDPGFVRPVAHRLTGSADVYGHKQREPEQSINFVTCHDGFTLNDLVSYNSKHNLANGQENRDGSDQNFSWNCGIEGPTDDPDVEKLRNRQVKNFLGLNLLAVGTPMILMGDEVRRTQRGNNNAYCQDDETSWLDWTLFSRHADIHRFARMAIALRLNRALPVERMDVTLNKLMQMRPIRWQGVIAGVPDWGQDSHTLAASVSPLPGLFSLYIATNAYWEGLSFELPPPEAGCGPWRRCIDTFLDSPNDICAWDDAPIVHEVRYLVQPRSIVLLAAKPGGAAR